MEAKKSSHFPNKLTLRDVIENDAATVYFYNHIVVVEVNEGVTLSYRTGFSLLLKGLTMLRGKPWVYISHRINSYAVVPTDYKYLNNVPTLKGMIIISPRKTENTNANLEKTFFKKDFRRVDTFEEAYIWAQKMLEK